MRILRTIGLLLLCTETPLSPPREAPLPDDGPAFRPVELAPAPTTVDHDIDTGTLVVQLHPEGWRSRGRQAVHDLTVDELHARVVPPLEAWPEDDLSQALLDVLCGYVDGCADGPDGEEALAALRDAADATDLMDAPLHELDVWKRYTRLWLLYAEAGGPWMNEDHEEQFVRELTAAWELTEDGPLADPLSAAMLFLVDDDRNLERAEELTLADDLRHVEIGWAWIAQDESTALDRYLDAEEVRPEADAMRVRHLLGRAVEEGHPSGRGLAEQLARHPHATAADQLDARDVQALADHGILNPWEQALVDDLSACADLEPGTTLAAYEGGWRFDGPAADCLYGWSSSGAITEGTQRILRVIP